MRQAQPSLTACPWILFSQANGCPQWRAGRACEHFSTGPTQLLRTVAPTERWDPSLGLPVGRVILPCTSLFTCTSKSLSAPTAPGLVWAARASRSQSRAHTRVLKTSQLNTSGTSLAFRKKVEPFIMAPKALQGQPCPLLYLLLHLVLSLSPPQSLPPSFCSPSLP